MKRIVSILFNRVFMVALAIILQFSWIFFTLYDFSIRFTFVDIGIRVLSYIVALTVINNWSNPYYKLVWTFTILALPLLGITLYAAFGRSELTKKTQRRMDAVHREISACLKTDTDAIAGLKEADPGVAQQSKYIRDWAQFPLYKNSKTKYYPCGEMMFADMLEAMRRAEKFIFLEYFIIEDGVMLQQILKNVGQYAGGFGGKSRPGGGGAPDLRRFWLHQNAAGKLWRDASCNRRGVCGF